MDYQGRQLQFFLPFNFLLPSLTNQEQKLSIRKSDECSFTTKMRFWTRSSPSHSPALQKAQTLYGSLEIRCSRRSWWDLPLFFWGVPAVASVFPLFMETESSSGWPRLPQCISRLQISILHLTSHDSPLKACSIHLSLSVCQPGSTHKQTLCERHRKHD